MHRSLMVLAETVHGRLGSLRQLVKTKEVPVKGAPDTRHIRTAIEQATVLPLSRGVFSLSEHKRHAAVLADAAGGEYLILEYREPGTILGKSACYMLALMDHAGKLTFRAVRQPALASCVFWSLTDLEIEKSVEKAR